MRWKAEQHEVKKREGDKRVFVQPDEMSSSESDNDSIISSAEDSLDERIQSMKVEEQESRGQDTGGKRNAFLKPKSTVKKWFHKHTSSKSSAETKETAKAVKAVV